MVDVKLRSKMSENCKRAAAILEKDREASKKKLTKLNAFSAKELSNVKAVERERRQHCLMSLTTY